MKLIKKFFLLCIIFLFSCNGDESDTLIIWTDRPEIAFYTAFFNASQDRFKAEVRYFDSPARQLSLSQETPDIVIASWLNSASTNIHFRPLDELFDLHGLEISSFYPQLLALGRINDRQLLLPVNFNLPSIIFPRERLNISANPFIIELGEVMDGAKIYNTEAREAYSTVGFSPLYNDDFLYTTAVLFGSSFMENSSSAAALPVSWDNSSLDEAIYWLLSWFDDGNTSIQMNDDFAYRYFFTPPDRLINSGRILFTYMDSSEFFTLPEERRINLSFRWLGVNERIPVNGGSVFYGIHRRSRVRRAYEAYTLWFFSEETQRQLLDASREERLDELSFGIAGGFSAKRTVTEQIFPQFYPALLGHSPPESYLSPPMILPRSWMSIKERVIIPYIQDRIRRQDTDMPSLERRISDWHRLNPN